MMDKMYKLNPTYPMNQVTANLIMNPKPPTLYALMNSIVNYGKEEQTKIRDLASECHEDIFDFEYDLSENVSKDQFEIDILNHYIERRIGFDTLTSFQLHLENKLHEILPYYNTLFDALHNYNLFNDGEVISRSLSGGRDIDTTNSSSTSGTNTSDRRYSKFPQNQLSDISSGSYVSEQNYDTDTLSNNIISNIDSNETNTENEIINRSPTDKMKLYESYLKTKNSIMSRIYKDLDCLFYQMVD